MRGMRVRGDWSALWAAVVFAAVLLDGAPAQAQGVCVPPGVEGECDDFASCEICTSDPPAAPDDYDARTGEIQPRYSRSPGGDRGAHLIQTVGPSLLDDFSFGSLLSSFGIPPSNIDAWTDAWQDGRLQEAIVVTLRDTAQDTHVEPSFPREPADSVPVPIDQGTPREPSPTGGANDTPEAEDKADPVNPANGELYIHRVDLSFPGFGQPYALVRTYRSRIDYAGVLGAGWDFTYNRRLLSVPASRRRIHFDVPQLDAEYETTGMLPLAETGLLGDPEGEAPPDCGPQIAYLTGEGTTLRFREVGRTDALILYESASGVERRLRGHRSGDQITWEMTEPSGLRQRFDERGLLLAVTDANGVGLAVTWEADGGGDWRVATITDSVGRVIRYEYGTGVAGRLLRVWEPVSGLEVRYAYNADRELRRAVDSTGRIESYEYDTDPNRTDGDWGPEGYLIPACELTCAPATSSCDAGGACDRPVEAAMDRCLGSCTRCARDCRIAGDPDASPPIPACYDSCSEGCAEGVGQTPGCEAQCATECDGNLPEATLYCNQAWDDKGRAHCELCEDECEAKDQACRGFGVCFGASGGEDGDPERFGTCLEGEGLDRLVDGVSDFFHGLDIVLTAVLEAIGCGLREACSWLMICSEPEDCFKDTKDQIEDACNQTVRQCCRDGRHCQEDSCNRGHGCADDCYAAFIGLANGNSCAAVSDPFAGDVTMDQWAEEHGCVPRIQAACPGRCTAQCEQRCTNECRAVCDTTCDEVCHTADCAGYCESLDLMGACQTGCVAGCIEAAHQKGPFIGPKYGYPRDLNHNIVRIRDGGGALYLEVSYGTDLARPDFDAVVSQNFGGFTSQIEYRDLEGEENETVQPPTSGPAATFIEDRSQFVPVELCTSACEGTSSEPESLFVPWSTQLLAFPPGDAGGLKVVSTGAIRGIIAPDLLLLTRRANHVSGESTAEPIGPPLPARRHAPFDVLLPQGRVTFTPTGVHSYAVTGVVQALDALAALGRVTVLSDGSGQIRVYPGSPTGSLRVAQGACRRPFRASVANGELSLAPADACSAKLVVAPLFTAVDDAAIKSSFELQGTAALDSQDLFQRSALVPVRGQIEWRRSDAGRYLPFAGLSGTAGDAHRAATVNAALHIPLYALPRTSNIARTPLFVSHEMENQLLAEGDRLAGQRSPYYSTINGLPLDESSVPLEIAPADYCPLGQSYPDVGDGGGVLPSRAAVMVDFYGVAWTYYFDRAGRVIRSVNHGTQERRDTSYDAAGRVQGARGEDGRRLCFRYDGDGNLRRAVEFPHVAVIGRQERFQPIQHRFTWSHLGPDKQTVRIAKIYDPRGTGSLTPPSRVLTSYIYDANGNLVAAVNGAGEPVRYELVGGTGPDRAMPRRRIGPDGSITEFEYDTGTGGVTRITVGLGRPDAVTTETVYDPAGRPVWQRSPLGEETTLVWSAGRLQSATRQSDNLADTTTFGYDNNSQLTSVHRDDRDITFRYDRIGGLQQSRVTPLDGSAATAVTCTRYGPGDRLLEQVMPEGNRVRYSHDGQGRVTQVYAGVWPASGGWDADCPASFNGSPASGSLATIEYRFDQPSQVTDARGIVLQIQDDGFGRVGRITTADGTTYRAGYDELGNIAWTGAYGPAGASVFQRRPQPDDAGLLRAEESFYDAAARPTEHRRWHLDSSGRPIGDGMATTRFAYDAAARKVTVTDDAGFLTTHFADPAGRPTRTILPTGGEVTTQYLRGGRTIATRWPAPTPSGLRSTTTELTGWGAVSSVDTQDTGTWVTLRSFGYDLHHRLTAVQYAEAHRLSVVYDAFDRPLQETTFQSGDPGEVVTHDWNRNGWLMSRLSSGDDVQDATTFYERDALGRVFRRTDPLGKTVTTEYLLASDTPFAVTDERGAVSRFSYDGQGDLHRVDVEHGGQSQSREFERDPLGQIVHAWQVSPVPDPLPPEVHTYLDWDSLGNRIYELNGTNRDIDRRFSVAHTFDGRGLLVDSLYGGLSGAGGDLRVTRTHDGFGRLVTVSLQQAPAVTFQYAPLGPPTGRADSNGESIVYQYDPLSRLVGLWHGRDAQTELASWRWAIPLDGVPRIAGLRKGAGAPETASVFTAYNSGALRSETREVSGLESLTLSPGLFTQAANVVVQPFIGVTSSWTRHTLDSRQNFSTVESSAGEFSPAIDPADAYQTFAGRPLTYDEAGSVLSDGLATYTYDGFGDLTSVDAGPAGRRRYLRDAFGRIAYERDETAGSTTRYAHDGWRRSLRHLPDGTWQIMVDGEALDEHLVSTDSTSERLFYHQDRNGNVYVVTDASAAPREWYDYTAYGDVTIRSPQGTPLDQSAIANRFGFQGQAFDSSLGLVDMRHRPYRPSLGRFLQRDPIGLAGGPNLYAFVDSAPLLFTDPLGLDKARLHNPAGPSPADYQSWLDLWTSRNAAARSHLDTVQEKIWRPDPAAYAYNMDLFRLGRRDALGPEYEAAADAADLAAAQLHVSPDVLQWLESRQALGVTITMDQLNAKGLEIAKWKSIYVDTMMSALLVGYPHFAGAPGMGRTNVPARVPVAEAPAAGGGLRGASTWGKPQTLADHFARHGGDFGARTADDYAELASDFLRRSQAERLPTKIDPRGVIRVYEPKTNTFGAYNPDGTTRTFYKPTPTTHGHPTNLDYWNALPGVAQ